VLGEYVKRYGFSPAISLDGSYTQGLMYPVLGKVSFPLLHFYDDAIPESQLNKTWIDLKA
jgi:hypothetical protein